MSDFENNFVYKELKAINIDGFLDKGNLLIVMFTVSLAVILTSLVSVRLSPEWEFLSNFLLIAGVSGCISTLTIWVSNGNKIAKLVIKVFLKDFNHGSLFELKELINKHTKRKINWNAMYKAYTTKDIKHLDRQEIIFIANALSKIPTDE